MDAAETSKAKIASLIQDWKSLSLSGFWCSPFVLKPMISFQTHFQAFDSDVMVATFPKCGTTWLKALTFSTLYRSQFSRGGIEHPLLNSTPHQLVHFLEIDVYMNNPFPDLENICVYKPRLFGTHVPYASLPTSIKDSKCKIVYICRNPMDMFISLWLFSNKLRGENQESLSPDKAFDMLCRGICMFGPFFDHALEYWNASQENPDKVLLLKYEDLKEDINSQLKRLAMFLGVPFNEDEEKQGVVAEIAKVCSFDKLRELEVNKKGVHISGIPHKDFFRKGKVGDWSNYLTPSMVERLEKLIHEKLDGSGLTFNFSSKISQDEA
ncbi:sulfotransferase 2A, ARABIDOPSIS THALIANA SULFOTRANSFERASE 2A [Hibiscus trionum]|uniref:Sulfotransferase n=1 Tax=Hibiscus trionum TaxID=183268 RepID=A0A9W7MH52_HIBTR|nr:sulfotransferase 2A, ARABIDOPSIS THALIANA SULFOTRANSFERASE 2A [Hibiscus trionum]